MIGVILNGEPKAVDDMTDAEARTALRQLIVAMERMNRRATRIEVYVEMSHDSALMRDVGPELAEIERIYDANIPERR